MRWGDRRDVQFFSHGTWPPCRLSFRARPRDSVVLEGNRLLSGGGNGYGSRERRDGFAGRGSICLFGRYSHSSPGTGRALSHRGGRQDTRAGWSEEMRDGQRQNHGVVPPCVSLPSPLRPTSSSRVVSTRPLMIRRRVVFNFVDLVGRDVRWAWRDERSAARR